MNEWFHYLHTHQLKKITKKLKQNAEQYGVYEGSPVEVHSAGIGHKNVTKFWLQRMTMYKLIGPLAIDLLSAPALQDYRHLWRDFSLCSLMTAGHRNQTEKSLEMRAFLTLNKRLLCSMKPWTKQYEPTLLFMSRVNWKWTTWTAPCELKYWT